MSNGPETLIGEYRKLVKGDGRKKSSESDMVFGPNLALRIHSAKKRK